MKPFTRSHYPPEAFDRSRYIALGVSAKGAKRLANDMRRAVVWKNDVYQVAITPTGERGLFLHLSVKRIDRAPIHDWRDLQEIKNLLVGVEREALELYPAESRRVDTANQYHLWVMPEGQAIPFGWRERAVMDDGEGPDIGAVQRPFIDTGERSNAYPLAEVIARALREHHS